MAKKKNKQKKSSTRRCVLIGLLAVVVILISAAGFAGYKYLAGTYVGPDVWVYVPAGATSEQVLDSLVKSLGTDTGRKVYDMWNVKSGDAAKAHGAYKISNGSRVWSIARRLETGRQTPVRCRWTGNRTLADVAPKITSALELTSEQFLEAARRILAEKGYSPEQMPAAFLPDTYEFYWTVTPDKLVERMLENTDRFWNDERRAKAEVLGLTPVQVSTLASIVEEETAKRDERPIVARLYLNRLAINMPLQADPTVKFAVGNPKLQRIKGKHLKIQSPYNTYINSGLPPGPIRIVEAATLDAVLDAPDHDYIYMCAKDDLSGYHNFTSDYSKHQQNARRYQMILDRKGIK